MKLKKLSMNAFGSYLHQVIDFTVFDGSAPFIITGKTGAGKTLIFDAIVYALYGEPSGNDRSAGMLRNNNARADEETSVTLSFSEGGKDYAVTRTMVMDGKGKILQRVLLSKPNGTVIEKEMAVTDEIAKIIGINREQFVQIVMIAQGAFQKFLFAGTAERQLIFRSLFNTDIYERIKEALSAETVTLKQENANINSLIAADISRISFAEEYPLRAKFEALKAKKLMVAADGEKALEQIEKGILFEKENEKRLRMELDNTEKLIGDLNVQISDAERINEYINMLESTERFLSDNKAVIEEKQIAFEEAEKQYSKKDKLNVEIVEDTQKLRDFIEIEELLAKLAETEKTRDALAERLNTAERKEREIAARLLDMRAEEETLSFTAGGLDRLELELERENAKQNKYKKIIELMNQLNVATMAFQKAKREYISAENEEKVATDKYESANRLFLDEQAGVLAERLSEGNPCPVCGSTVHPNPAKKSDGAPSEQELKNLEVLSKKAKASATEKSLLSAKAGEQFNNIQKALDASVIELYPEKNRDDAAVQAENDKWESEEKIRNLNDEADLAYTAGEQLAMLKKEIAEEELSAKSVSEQKEQIIGELSLVKDEYTRRESVISSKRESVGEGSRAETEKRIAARRAQIAEADKAYNAARIALESATQRSKDAETERAIHEKNIGGRAFIDTAVLAESLDAEQKKKGRLMERFSVSSANLSTGNAAFTSLKELFSKLTDNEKELTLKNGLYKIISGDENKNVKFSLEAYAQSIYFKSIIAEANKILNDLTNGRYSLRYKETATNLKKKSGLDLEIRNINDALPRDIKSLSGGESFLASLSLALGLSVFVQRRSGGIRLETMFIDEGFGSLDAETLKTAINALIKLSQQDKKMIGLISHITELHESIENRITVTNLNGVSSAEVTIS